ncbi:hypothetical protein SAMN05444266_101853 [Chitinophaga jiangningensis]|uniref:Uncharacterized protein n=1 Tax=Chitinophaga jiangningensis TaxID=1419482 RepID=A0A1M6X1D1_9BACT|nr:hypothetical protein [Chitinophaga jiangningensis]SHK99800.1 hypothetical protein SAMN05444266_101853 [Chitinophaga jiangningensis]
MKKGNDILNELLQIAPGANWPADQTFSVPTGYFDQLPEIIADKIRLQDAVNASLSQRTPFSPPPENYFEQLPAAILSQVAHSQDLSVVEELEAVSPFLAALPKTTPFSLPENYFNHIQTAITEPTPVIPISKTRKATWTRWAAAASIIAILGTSALFFIGKEHYHHDYSDIENQLTAISDEDIIAYLQNHADAFDNETIFAQAAKSAAIPQLEKQIHETVPGELLQHYMLEASLANDELPNE